MAYNTVDECKHRVYRNKILKHIVCVWIAIKTLMYKQILRNCYFDKSRVKMKKLNSLKQKWNLLNSILRITININTSTTCAIAQWK